MVMLVGEKIVKDEVGMMIVSTIMSGDGLCGRAGGVNGRISVETVIGVVKGVEIGKG